MRVLVCVLALFAAQSRAFQESFDRIAFPPGEWLVRNADASIRTWQRLDHDFLSAPGCAFCGHDAQTVRNHDWLVTPQCTAAAGDSFSFWCRAKDGAFPESLEVWISTSSPYIPSFVQLDAFTTTGTAYERHQYDLAPYVGQHVFLALVYRSQGQPGILVDDMAGPEVWYPRPDLGVIRVTGIADPPLRHLRKDQAWFMQPRGVVFNYGASPGMVRLYMLVNSAYRQVVSFLTPPPGDSLSAAFPYCVVDTSRDACSLVCYLGFPDTCPWNDTGRLTHFFHSFVARGGPDSFGYCWYDSDDSAGPDYAWYELWPSGTRLGGGDDSVFRLDLPWQFRFYGQDYSTAWVSTNGWLSFTQPPGPNDSNVTVPNALEPNCLVAPFWDDLVSAGQDAGVWCGSTGDSLFIIEWRNVGCDGAWRESLNFQVHLYRSGVIEFHYKDVAVWDERFDQGASATIGIENQSGTVGLEYLCNGSPPGNHLYPQRAIRFQPWQGGVEERTTLHATRHTPDATIIRGLLWLPRDMTQTSDVWDRVPRPRAVLLDASGRLVMSLRPGLNDIRHLAPGVYFVRPASGVERDASSLARISKVILTK